MDCIFCSEVYKSVEVNLSSYKAIAKPHLEYCVQFCSEYYINNESEKDKKSDSRGHQNKFRLQRKCLMRKE